MGYTMDEFYRYLVDLARFVPVWEEWLKSEPSFFRHPIKYLKWYFSEPKYEKFIKENKNVKK